MKPMFFFQRIIQCCTAAQCDFPFILRIRRTKYQCFFRVLRLNKQRNQDLIKAINTRKNPWTINSLAEIAGRLMFPDEEYIRHTRELICRERDRLYNELSTWDSVTVYEASANFILMKIRKPGITSQDLFDHCIRKGLMIRDCSTFPFLDDHFVRFCVMLPEQNDRLLEAFKEVLL